MTGFGSYAQSYDTRLFQTPFYRKGAAARGEDPIKQFVAQAGAKHLRNAPVIRDMRFARSNEYNPDTAIRAQREDLLSKTFYDNKDNTDLTGLRSRLGLQLSRTGGALSQRENKVLGSVEGGERQRTAAPSAADDTAQADDSGSDVGSEYDSDFTNVSSESDDDESMDVGSEEDSDDDDGIVILQPGGSSTASPSGSARTPGPRTLPMQTYPPAPINPLSQVGSTTAPQTPVQPVPHSGLTPVAPHTPITPHPSGVSPLIANRGTSSSAPTISPPAGQATVSPNASSAIQALSSSYLSNANNKPQLPPLPGAASGS